MDLGLLQTHHKLLTCCYNQLLISTLYYWSYITCSG